MGACLLWALPTAASAVCIDPTPTDLDGLMSGMGVAATAISPALTGERTMFAELTELGPVAPQDGATMAMLFTGDVTVLCDPNFDTDHGVEGADDDVAQVEFSLDVPSGAQSLVIEFYFLSREYPEYVGQEFNDTFEVFLSDGAGTRQIVFDSAGNVVSVNNALFNVTGANDLLETGFDGRGGTGWLQTRTAVTEGDQIDLRFTVQDLGHGVFDSAVLLDVIEFSETPVDGSTTCPDADSTNDPDGDGVADVCDNCPDDFQEVQADADGNGIGDVCDVDDGPAIRSGWLQGGRTGGRTCSAAGTGAPAGVLFTLSLSLGLAFRRRTT